VYERLSSMGLDVIKPEGAFYIFPSVKKFGLKSFDLLRSFLKCKELLWFLERHFLSMVRVC